MNNILRNSIHKKISLVPILFFTICINTFAQNTTVRGIVRDSLTNELLPFVTIQFEETTVGAFTDEQGKYTLIGNQDRSRVAVSFLGYHTYHFTVPKGQRTTKNILLQPTDMSLKEVVVTPKKQKYSKKNNPAVDLIKKVIEHKKENNIRSQDNYQFEEYERTVVALNDFKPEQSQFKRYKFLPKYIDTSLIDKKTILPISVREKLSDVYYQKSPQDDKQVVKGFKVEGLDQTFETEAINATIKEVFQNISIYDNSITLLLHKFVGPLSEHSSVNFYKWYIEDTVSIENKRYIEMSFVPFNSRDVGFIGHLYISTDGTYGVKRAVLRTPSKMNINFVSDMVIHHEFTQNEFGKWIPIEEKTAIDLSLLDAVKIYVEKSRSLNDIRFDQPAKSIHKLSAPIILEKDYLKRGNDFWAESRPINHKHDYKMGEMMEELYKDKVLKTLLVAGNIFASGYIATHEDPEKNIIDIGTVPTFFSYNPTEGGRFRFTAATTPVFHRHLYLYAYTAYGLKDRKTKYLAEATWAFNKVEKNKEEYPRNNLTVSYKYDMNNLGQRFNQAERDNIFMSLQSSHNEKVTYNKEIKVSYEKEYYGGFSSKLTAQIYDERPAGELVFRKIDPLGYVQSVRGVKSTEVKLALRYAHNEKFYQQRRRRTSIPAEKFIVSAEHTLALKGAIGGEYSYNKSSVSLTTEKWVAPYGKITASVEGEKIWGEVPFPLLISPGANNSYTIQKGNFYLIEPLEFIHDKQVSWEIYYHMGGWLFNRIPLLNQLKWREIAGFRGLYGGLDDRNNPAINRDQLEFPDASFTTNKKPYMEYNIGIENIFKFFRIDYVRRVNYLDHPNVDKDGFRISFDMTF